MASASVRRPSASVFSISIVFPFMAVTMSPGFDALPDGMFSVAAMSPCTSAFGARSGSTAKRPRTAAAPAMSHFMVSMWLDGLSDKPPESKVMPLPMMAIFLSLGFGVLRFVGTAGNGHERTHARFLALSAIHHLEPDPRPACGDLLGVLLEVRRGHAAGRFVHQVARVDRAPHINVPQRHAALG